MGFTDQPRTRFATLPTPLQFAPRLSEELGGPKIYLKRDDLTGLALGGNKTRKLEYLVADAQAQGATHLITVGAAQSNHARQTAAAARLAGMECHLVLNASSTDPEVQGNLLLDKLLGATVHVVVGGSEERQAKVDEVAADLSDSGAVPYVIPGGGSNGVGSLGYVGAMLELSHQLWEQSVQPKAMYFAAGGGGTHSGIIVGAKLFNLDFAIIGVLVEGKNEAGVERAYRVTGWTAERLGIDNPVAKSDIVCDDGHVGEGYGIPTEEGLDAIKLLARTEGVLLDPVYTSKAFAGMVADIRAGRYGADDAVVFLHTGGSPALFAQTDILLPVLDE
ncbi:MAG TPA: D-cysteine desulfhydrase family protein [Thermomicrobiales bacterium]|nr:D-cysteine desulfhydrase family protein [Thermomicrobiales bacterium]